MRFKGVINFDGVIFNYMIIVFAIKLVTGPGVEPGLGDYEPPVPPYTTPYNIYYNI